MRTSLKGRAVGPKKSKYSNIKMVVDNITFASRKEGRRYQDLKILLRSGAIQGLDLQPEYEFYYQGVKICKYIADFRYIENNVLIVEDVKGGPRTPVYRIKAKLLKAFFNITVRET